jgi:hypothetical protein
MTARPALRAAATVAGGMMCRLERSARGWASASFDHALVYTLDLDAARAEPG